MDAEQGETIFNRLTALTTIKGFAAMTLDLVGAFGTAGGRFVNSGGIDIIADAMDHDRDLLQLRMIVN